LWKPSWWVLKNKIRLLLGKDIIWDVEDGDIEDKVKIEDKKERYYQMISS